MICGFKGYFVEETFEDDSSEHNKLVQLFSKREIQRVMFFMVINGLLSVPLVYGLGFNNFCFLAIFQGMVI